jgi:copper transport protein
MATTPLAGVSFDCPVRRPGAIDHFRMPLASSAPSLPASRARTPGARPTLLASITLLVAIAIAIAIVAPPAEAHERLVRSAPASGDTLAGPPTELRLTFSSRVELAFSGIELLGPDGRPVALGPLSSPADSSRLLVTAVLGAMAPGRYTVAWRTGGADGHPVRGSYTFVVRGTAAGAPDTLAAGTTDSVAVEHAGHADGQPVEPASSPVHVLVRWITFVALLGAIGVVGFRWLVLPRAAVGAPAPFAGSAERGARTLGVMLAALLLAAVLARLAVQWAALGGDGGNASIGSVLATTEWGWGWMLQLAGTLLALAGFVVASRSRAGWSLAALAVPPLALAPALSGHAAATGSLAPLTIAVDAAHVLAGGIWIGTLFALVVAGLPAALSMPAGARGPAAARLFRRFSPIALGAAGVLLASGVVSAWAQLGSIAALFSSAYGQMLLRKLVFLVIVAAFGAFHWKRALPALGSDASVGTLRRTATVELLMAGAVLVVTAFLVATPPPAQ